MRTDPAEPTRIHDLLVMPLQPEEGLERASRALDELILAEVHGVGWYQVLGPADLNALLGVEAAKDALGCDDVDCAADLGGALGVRTVVTGELRALEDQVLLSLRQIDTDGAPLVLTRATARGRRDADTLAGMVAEVVQDLLGEGRLPVGPTPLPASPVALPDVFAELELALAASTYEEDEPPMHISGCAGSPPKLASTLR